jgi:hypothetical protein
VSYDELYSHASRTGGLPRAPRNPVEMKSFREHCPTLAKFIGVQFGQMRNSLLQTPELRQIVSVLSAYITDDVGQLSFANRLPPFGYYFRGGHYPSGGSQRLAPSGRRSQRAMTICAQEGTSCGSRDPIPKDRRGGGQDCGGPVRARMRWPSMSRPQLRHRPPIRLCCRICGRSERFIDPFPALRRDSVNLQGRYRFSPCSVITTRRTVSSMSARRDATTAERHEETDSDLSGYSVQRNRAGE